MTQDDWPLDIEPGQKVEIDLFRAEDAPGVAALFQEVYGDDYPVKIYYDPEQLARENAAGRIISSVARTPRGEVVGHVCLFNSSSPNLRQYEVGAGGVLSSYRNTAKLQTRLMIHGPRVAADRFGLEVVFGDPICTHVYSQKICKGLGWTTHALVVDMMPARLYDREAPEQSRVSAIIDFGTLVPKPHLVYLPVVYREALGFLYEGLDDTRQLELSRETVPPGSVTRIESTVFAYAQLARLAVWEAGEDLVAALAKEEEAVTAQGVKVIQLWLQLSCPWIGQAVDILRRRGYFLGGLLPRWFDQDGLLMLRMRHHPQWNTINLEYDRAKTLRSLVQDDWRKVCGAL